MKKRRNILLALDWYHPKLHRGIAHFAREHNWHLNTEMARMSGHIPCGWNGDGILTQLGAFQVLKKNMNLSQPCVFLNHQTDALRDEISISDDNEKIAQIAADHFLQKGFKFFACYGPSHYVMGERIKAFTQKLSGFDCSFLVTPGKNPDFGVRHQYLLEELPKLNKPVAIFAPTDEWAAEIIEACMDLEINIPEDIAVIGVRNDDLICEALNVPLSSVENNLYEVGYQAAALLERKMNGEELEAKHYSVAPLGVEARQSTEIDLAVHRHEGFAKLMSYMRENFRDSSVDCNKIARENAMSLRQLYNVFTICDKGSPAKYLLELRLQEAATILEHSNTTIETIAGQSGFRSNRTCYQAFKKKYKISPNQYRKQMFQKNRR